jgi:adenylate cyclase
MSLFLLLKQHGVRFALSLAIVTLMLLHASDVTRIVFVDQLENLSYDMRLKLLMPNTVDERIVIVDIDEKSLKEQGRWPWGRDKLAKMVDQLFDTYHVNTLGFDVVFAEKDESSGLKNLEAIQKDYLKNDAAFNATLAEIKPKLDYDQLFADSLKNRKVVMGYFFAQDGGANRIGQLPPPLFSASSFGNKNINATENVGFGANLALLQQNALSAGHFNPDPDSDGITRKISALIKYDGNYYDALSIAIARAYLNAPSIQPEFATLGTSKSYSGLESFKIADKHVPVDAKVAVLVPYRGVQDSFHYVSATDVLNHKVPAAMLKDKIVLVGTSAAGLLDLRATPVQSVYPGVEVHANMISGILDDNIKQRPAFTLGAEVVMLLLLGILLGLFLPILNPLKATLLTVLVLAAVIMINLSSWQYGNLVLPIASSLFMISLMYLVNMSYGFMIESREKRQLAGLFGQYVPPELVDEMAKNPEAINLEGESRDMTVLFSDIRGFTNISEGLDPKQLTLLMNELLTPLTQVIHSNRGTIDKYMGDAIMAFWGAPLEDKNHALHALEAAMQMVAALKPLNVSFAAKGWPAIRMGVGLNTGNMTVGNMGSSFRMAYTVMGDAVNLGSRLEGITKFYGVDIIASEFVKAQVPSYVYRELDIVRVKGKDKPVTIFEPLGLEGEVSKDTLNELKLYREALKLYRNQNWDLSEMQFINLHNMNTQQVLYSLYIERIKQYRRSPPDADWDGAFNFEAK